MFGIDASSRDRSRSKQLGVSGLGIKGASKAQSFTHKSGEIMKTCVCGRDS